MRTRFTAAAFPLAIVLSAASGFTSAAAQSAPPPQTQLIDVLPPSTSATQLALTADAQRVYYGDSTRALWFYDRGTKRTVPLAPGEVFDLTLSPRADALAYARATLSGAAEHYIYVLPLDARTGLPSGPERRVSVTPGDAPAIAPDGKSLAFARDDASGVSQSVAVIELGSLASMTGRVTERTLAGSLHSSISNIRWSPDGQSIYFGVNPPVPCNPDWSCLELKPEFVQRSGTLERVSLASGKIDVVTSPVANGWPGLSADGSLLAFSDSSFPPNLVVANTDGRVLRTVAVARGQTVEGWLAASTLLFSDRGDVQRLRSFSIADGSTHLVADSLASIADPLASPDGTMMDFVTCAAGRCEMRIQHADGSSPRTIALPDTYRGFGAWSPDAKHIAYFGDAGTSGELHPSIVDVAAGSVKTFDAARANAWALSWTDDSRAITLSLVIGGAGATRRLSLERIALDGSAQFTRELPLGKTPSVGRAVDMTSAVTIRGTEIQRAAFDGDSVVSTLLPKVSARYLGWFAVSADRQRFVFRRTTDSSSDEPRILEIVNRDGSGRVTIQLPFILVNGTTTIQFLPGGAQLLVEGFSDDVDGVGVYVIDIATKSAKRVLAIPGRVFTRELSLSPDGRTIFYVTNERSTSRVFTMDLSSLRDDHKH